MQCHLASRENSIDNCDLPITSILKLEELPVQVGYLLAFEYNPDRTCFSRVQEGFPVVEEDIIRESTNNAFGKGGGTCYFVLGTQQIEDR